MYAQVEKPKENKSKAVAISVRQKKSDGKQCFGFVDNRPEAIAQRKRQVVMQPPMVQQQPLALADRPWEEIEELSATFGREAVLAGELNHVPTRDQMVHNLLSPPGSSTEGRKPVMVTEVNGAHEGVGLRVREIGEEWIRLGGNPDKEKGEYECSGKDWNQNDEGADVARDLQISDKREQDTSGATYEKCFVAHYVGETQPIAIMLLEMRTEDLKEKNKQHLYIRWLLGSPVTKGGGATLVNVAKAEALKVADGELRVDSARSAVEWYNKQGFSSLYSAKHVSDPDNERNDPEKSTLADCGCKFMTWTKESP